MRFSTTFNVLMIVGALLLSFSAQASSVEIGTACTQLGATSMSDDHKSILACLLNENGTSLNWKASYTPPTCKAGQLLTTDTSGNLRCTELQCRVVRVTAADWQLAKCNSDEFVMNGGGLTAAQCPNQFGFLHSTYPWAVGYGGSWAADGFGAIGPADNGSGGTVWVDDTHTDVCATTFATCCKFTTQP